MLSLPSLLGFCASGLLLLLGFAAEGVGDDEDEAPPLDFLLLEVDFP
jgi:hypothetical protein